MDIKQIEIRELAQDEVKNLVTLCKEIESARSIALTRGNQKDLQKALNKAVKTHRKFQAIKFNDVTIESNYDVSSRNHFTRIEYPDSLGGEYQYTGHIESRAITHIWAIIEHFSKES